MSVTKEQELNVVELAKSNEEALLASFLLDERAFTSYAPELSREDFHFHKALFSAVQTAYEDDGRTDLVTVVGVLRKNGLLATLGGTDYVISVAESVPTPANVDHYFHLVKGQTEARKRAWEILDRYRETCAISSHDLAEPWVEYFLERLSNEDLRSATWNCVWTSDKSLVEPSERIAQALINNDGALSFSQRVVLGPDMHVAQVAFDLEPGQPPIVHVVAIYEGLPRGGRA